MSSTSPIILLDTDIGSDPDDAFALAYLLRQSWPLDGPADSNLPRLAGITSVSGESNLRASLCSAMLYSEAATHENLARESGKNASYHAQAAKELRNLPVVCGRSDPLVEKQRQPKCQQSVVLKDFDHATFDSDASGDSAVSFLASTILSRPPNTVTLLTIGPMTNIALLFSSHPSIPSRLARLVSMSGIFFTRLEFAINGLSEWNVFLDPHAAQTVCSVSAPAFFVGLDVTTRVTMLRTRLEGLAWSINK
jgi:purine nucleosidase